MTKHALVISDWHCGHRLGLMPENTTLFHEDEHGDESEWIPSLTSYQIYLWSKLNEYLKEASEIVNGEDVTLIVNGDITQGKKYPSLWVSTRMSDQIEIAQGVIEHIINLVPNIKNIRISTGTESHEFGEGSAPRIIHKYLGYRYQDINSKVVNHGISVIDGVSFDYAHHGPSGGRSLWLSGNSARSYLKDIMLSDIVARGNHSRVVIRSHVHTYIHETVELRNNGKIAKSDIFVTPSWCGKGDYARQATRSIPNITHGLILFSVDKGEFEYRVFIDDVDTRSRENI